jgi:hypothetical protein
VLRRRTRVAGITARDLPRAVVDMSADRPNIRVDVAMAWPGRIAEQCGQVREEVVAHLRRYTGRTPSRVDVEVAELVVAPPEAADVADPTSEDGGR